jgi:hypothetical protein
MDQTECRCFCCERSGADNRFASPKRERFILCDLCMSAIQKVRDQMVRDGVPSHDAPSA